MHTYQECSSAPVLQAKDFPDALRICSEIRQGGDSSFRKIRIASSVIKGNYVFPYSDFCLEFQKGNLLTSSHSGNEYDGELLSTRTTWHTATLTVWGDENVFLGMNVENAAGNPKENGTSVALSVFGDQNLFVKCGIASTQDTLFLGPLPDDLAKRYVGFLPKEETDIQGNLRNYFMNCSVKGSVDFVFGAGQGLFHNCLFESIYDGRDTDNYVCAPAHSLKDDFGFCFVDCSFVSKIAEEKTYLARPWRDFGKACFINCTYGEHIKREGFCDWSKDSQRKRTCRFEEYPLEKGRVGWVYNDRESKKILDRYLEEVRKI